MATSLANGQFALKIEDTGIHVRYYETRLPLDPKIVRSDSGARCPRFPEIAAILRATSSACRIATRPPSSA